MLSGSPDARPASSMICHRIEADESGKREKQPRSAGSPLSGDSPRWPGGFRPLTASAPPGSGSEVTRAQWGFTRRVVSGAAARCHEPGSSRTGGVAGPGHLGDPGGLKRYPVGGGSGPDAWRGLSASVARKQPPASRHDCRLRCLRRESTLIYYCSHYPLLMDILQHYSQVVSVSRAQ